MIKGLNLNVSSDDSIINHYLMVSNLMDSIPNRVNLFMTYDSKSFEDYFSNNGKEVNKITDVYPTTTTELVNERNLIKLDSGIYVSYVNYDRDTEESIVSDVVIFYSIDRFEIVQTILDEIKKFSKEESDDYEEDKINTITFDQSGFNLESIDPFDINLKKFGLYYNDDVILRSKSLIKSLNAYNKGLSIIFGERGSGKTHLLSWISLKVEKSVIFLPYNMIESMINNLDFRTFLKRCRNSILIIDDCETYCKNILFVDTILHMVDGFSSDNLDINIVLSINIKSMNEVESSLLECNNMIDCIEVSKLKKEKVKLLMKSLKREPLDGDFLLRDVMRDGVVINKKSFGL